MRGSPLIMLAVVLVAWTAGRALTWENPFQLPVAPAIVAEAMLAQSERSVPTFASTDKAGRKLERTTGSHESDGVDALVLRLGAMGTAGGTATRGSARDPVDPAVALGHNLLWLRSLGAKLPPGEPLGPLFAAIESPARQEGYSPIAPLRERSPVRLDRWSFDAWGFWREGSDSTAISQGRVPIYGASQIGAKLSYRLAPAARQDPQAYLRGYRALVRHGENEGAVGVSARPVGALPLRLAAELRITDTRFGIDARPAIMATTELPPQMLPGRFRLEAYGGAGYVGGEGATAFADGQASLTREVIRSGGTADNPARLSLGAGAWAGAQEDAHRVDVGPTMRVDLTLGKVPARISVDWRERIGGDASPGSGLAATLSTRF